MKVAAEGAHVAPPSSEEETTTWVAMKGGWGNERVIWIKHVRQRPSLCIYAFSYFLILRESSLEAEGAFLSSGGK